LRGPRCIWTGRPRRTTCGACARWWRWDRRPS